MALALNLLHEELHEQRQRKRDPLKISMYVAIGISSLLALNYAVGAYKLLESKSRLAGVQREWSKEEPKVAAAQKRAEELNGVINATTVLDQLIESRFYWAPMMAIISHCVTPNIQLSDFEGAAEQGKGVTLALDGTAAGREPRAVAEDFRQLLLEQIGKQHKDVKVEFKVLEDLDTAVNVGGASVPTAHFVVDIAFDPFATKTQKPAQPQRAEKKKHSDE